MIHRRIALIPFTAAVLGLALVATSQDAKLSGQRRGEPGSAPKPLTERELLKGDIEDEAFKAERLSASSTFEMLRSTWAKDRLGVTEEQRKLVTQFEAATRLMLRSAILMKLDALDDPPKVRLRRLQQIDRNKKIIINDAEEIALLGILTEQQAENMKIIRWRNQGIHALTEEEVASRLGLTEQQRETIARLCLNARQVRSRAEVELRMLRKEAARKAVAEIESRTESAENLVWEALGASQLKKWNRLMERAEQLSR
jgi:hypothetical protein